MAIPNSFALGLVSVDTMKLTTNIGDFYYSCRFVFSLLSPVGVTGLDHRTTTWRPRHKTGRRPLYLVFTTPQAMFVSSAALFSTHH
jgi:hypothetical protein